VEVGPLENDKIYTSIHAILLHRVSQDERSVSWEVIVSVILGKNFVTYMCLIPNGFRDRAFSLYSFKIVSNAGIYRSSDKASTVYLV
jgi:hypothetical protein